MDKKAQDHHKNLNGHHAFTHWMHGDKEHPNFGLWYCYECLKSKYSKRID